MTDNQEKDKTRTKRIKKNPTKKNEEEEQEQATKQISKIAKVICTNKPLPTRNSDNELVFPDFPEFRPNLTPKEVIQLGSFGGTYFRPIYSSVLKQNLKDQHKEFPQDWFENLDPKLYLTSDKYIEKINKYKVKCGGSLEMWESSGWINGIDPYGWFQWYCRFYLGRRCSDDSRLRFIIYRQVLRGLQCFGPSGRWRINLYNKCIRSGKNFDEYEISPVIRQVLQHWGYSPNLKDFLIAKSKFKK